MLGSQLAEATARPVSFKGKRLKVTAPDGTVYRFTWQYDRKPSQSDMAWAQSEAQARHASAQELKPADPFKVDETLPEQVPPDAFGKLLRGTIEGLSSKTKPGKPDPEQDVPLLERLRRVVATAPGPIGHGASSRFAKDMAGVDYGEGVKHEIAQRGKVAKGLSDVMEPGLKRTRKAVEGAVKGAVRGLAPDDPNGVSAGNILAKGVLSLDPTPLLGAAGALADIDKPGTGAKGDGGKAIVNGIMKFLANPVGPTLSLTMGIDEDLALRAAKGDKDANEEILGKILAFTASSIPAEKVLSALKGKNAGAAVEKLVREAKAFEPTPKFGSKDVQFDVRPKPAKDPHAESLEFVRTGKVPEADHIVDVNKMVDTPPAGTAVFQGNTGGTAGVGAQMLHFVTADIDEASRYAHGAGGQRVIQGEPWLINWDDSLRVGDNAPLYMYNETSGKWDHYGYVNETGRQIVNKDGGKLPSISREEITARQTSDGNEQFSGFNSKGRIRAASIDGKNILDATSPEGLAVLRTVDPSLIEADRFSWASTKHANSGIPHHSAKWSRVIQMLREKGYDGIRFRDDVPFAGAHPEKDTIALFDEPAWASNESVLATRRTPTTPPAGKGAKPKEPWEMTREEFGGQPDTFSHAQPNADHVTQSEAGGMRLTDTLQKHVRSDNEITVEGAPRTAWALRGTTNPYGKHIGLFDGHGARILREGTAEFKKLTNGLRKASLRNQTAAPDVVARAQHAGYDAVEFNGTNIGTVIINPDAFPSHRMQVERALSEGKPVPAEVLADYPDLAAKYGSTTPPAGKGAATGAPESTGIANAVQDAEEAAGKLNESPRATGTKKGDAHAQGKAAVENGEIDPQALAREIAEGKRTFKDETEVGALIEGKRRLMRKVEALRRAVDQDHSPEAAQRYADAQDELAEYVQNVQSGKGKWSDVGRALQEGTTIDEGNFDDVLAEYRRRSPDGKVNPKEEAALKKQVDEYNALKERAEAAEAEVLRMKAEAGLSRASESVRRGTPGRRTVQQIQAEKLAARENIRKSIQKALSGGPMGSGLGGLSDAFDAIPELAREIRKLIELHIEEFKVGKLDSDFYVQSKKLIRDVLDDDEWEALGVDPKTLTDRDVNKVLAGYYEQTSKTVAGTKNMVAELKKQAQLLDQIEGALAGDVIRYGSKPGNPSVEVATLRKQLNELLSKIGEGPGADAARTRLRDILKDLEAQKAGKYRNIKDTPNPQAVDTKAIRAKIAEVRKDMRLEDTLADLDEQLRTGNLKGPEKRVRSSTAQQLRLEDEVAAKRKVIREKIRAGNRGPFEKVLHGVDRVFSTMREGVATGDISFPGIQGAALLLTDTKAWGRGAGAAFRSYGRMGYDETTRFLRSDPEFDLVKSTGVDLPSISGEYEELFQNSALQRAPVIGKGVKAAARSYDGSATVTRFMTAKAHIQLATELNGGKPLSEAALKQIGESVNSMSGRASSAFGKRVRSADFGRGFFAPSYWASLFESTYRPFTTAIDHGFKTGEWGNAKLYTRKMGRLYAASASVLATSKLLLEGSGWDVELDPRSNLFGKANKVVNGKVVSLDLLPPQIGQPTRLFGMLFGGKKDIAGDVDTSARGRMAALESLLEGKAAPGPKLGLNIRDSVHVTNEKGNRAQPSDYPFGKNYDPRTGEGWKNIGIGQLPISAQQTKELVETDALTTTEKLILLPFMLFSRGPNIYPASKSALKKMGKGR